ncbi:MAG: Asp-tRNA(Asn)/Glu-tRNA(Gln) amidotransferase subunit GatA [Planctomycetes bacterium]|nr:Asp-tRNA(Asn)/Glu-tRNA(Gln) amidotransferase subunit GatA [Planctomycetota bacterium]
MTALWQLSARQLARLVQSGEVSARELARTFLDRVDRLDPALRAFVDHRGERALADADAVDAALARGEPVGPLAGVPVAWKDNLVRRGEVTSAGSRMLASYRSPFTATALQRLEAAGAVLLGRTNMDEFGMGSSTENSAHGPTRNPWQPDCVPGGSSGGSAAAVAADLCPLAVGSDTGGSVRQPAALCGVVGLKPSYGRVSRSGLIAYASSLDCVGVLARTVDDAALWLRCTAGSDPGDPTSAAEALPEFAVEARPDLRGLRIGLPWELNGPGLADEIEAVLADARAQLRTLGAELVECSLPHVSVAVPTYYLLAMAEAASNLARYDGVRYGFRGAASGSCEAMTTASRSSGFGAEVQRRLLLGTFALSCGYQDEYYGKATQARERLREDFRRAFAGCDLLVSPTSPVPAFPLGSRIDDPLAMYLCDALTVPASLAGLPALSQPCGRTAAGLPVGLQWMAPPRREDLLLQAAHVFERHTDHHLPRALP